MHEEVVWIRVACIRISIVYVGPRIALAVVEDDNFIYAKYSEGAGDLAC